MFAEIDPFDSGMLDVGDGQQIYWECCGNPEGRAVVYLHGGPGSGCTPRSRRLVDPAIYKIVLTDQRGCGRSRPLVEKPQDLNVNTTAHLIRDLEYLRERLLIDRWSVVGASWGTTLGLAYAQQHPDRVTAMVLASVTTTSSREVRWLTYDVGRIFPDQWSRFAAIDANDSVEDRSLVEVYATLVFSDEPQVRERAAREWCAWEDTHVSLAPSYRPNPRFDDGAFRLLFARLVTHYWRNAAFLSEDQLIRNAPVLAGIPGVLIHGRYDVSSPLETAWMVHKAWPGSVLRVVDDAGHGGGSMPSAIADAVGQLVPG